MQALQSGNLVYRIKKLHDQYGDVVRIGPNELSFTNAPAFQDIYGHIAGRQDFVKNPIWMRRQVNGVHSIVSANDEDHSRYRRLLAYAFSDKALRQQEPLLQTYVDLLIKRLHEKTDASVTGTAVVDIVEWFNFTTFDIIGDLSFGESFHCLEEAQYHPWVSILFSHFKAASLFIGCRYFPIAERLMRKFLPKQITQNLVDHFAMSKAKVHHRLEQRDGQKPDFMSHVLRHNDEKGMSVPEIEATFNMLVLAGSETSATALSGTMNYLLKSANSSVLQNLVTEIRDSFGQEADITSDRVNRLPYLGAVIEEGLRLCVPVAIGLPRLVPPGGSTVAGHFLPGGTNISAPLYASNRSSHNFPDPEKFLPERWLARDGQESLRNYAFNPFSIGPRNCIGMQLAYVEIRLILARLLWNFDLQNVESEWDWSRQMIYVLWEKDPLMVSVKARPSAKS